MDNPALVLFVLGIAVAVALVGLVMWGVRKPKRDYIPKTGPADIRFDKPINMRNGDTLEYRQSFGRALRPAPQPVDLAKLTPVHQPGQTYGGERLDPPTSTQRAYGGARGGGKNVYDLAGQRRRMDDDRRSSYQYSENFNDPLSPTNPNSFLYESTASPSPAPAPSYEPPACSPPPDSGSSGGIDFGSSSGCSDGGW